MTDRLKETRARLEAATPGPWEAEAGFRDADDGQGHYTIEDGSGAVSGPARSKWEEESIGMDRMEDAIFIAHAPADIAYLLAIAEAVEVLLSHVWLGGNTDPEAVAVSSFMPPAETNIMKAMEGLRAAYFAEALATPQNIETDRADPASDLYRIKLAITGGEDAPGHANTLTVDDAVKRIEDLYRNRQELDGVLKMIGDHAPPALPTQAMLEAMQAVADEGKMDLCIDDELRLLYSAAVKAAPDPEPVDELVKAVRELSRNAGSLFDREGGSASDMVMVVYTHQMNAVRAALAKMETTNTNGENDE